MNTAPKFVLLGHSKDKIGKETPPDVLIMDNLETFLDTRVYKARINKSGAIVERFTKPRSSTMFGHLVYLMDGPGPSISVSVPHEIFLNSTFALWIGGNHFSYGCCRTIKMHELWRALVLR